MEKKKRKKQKTGNKKIKGTTLSRSFVNKRVPLGTPQIRT
jgi:hypothetical protein